MPHRSISVGIHRCAGPDRHAAADPEGTRMATSRATLALAATAAGLAATALLNRASARRAEREHPPRGRLVEAGGIGLHYIEGGQADGPPVVLLHGNAVRAEDWIASG